MAERVHNCGCETCAPNSVPEEAPPVCSCVEDGFRASLERWKESCDCCFSEAYPGGVDEAIAKAKATA